MNYLGIDLGGTNIVAAVVNEKFEIVSEAKNPTLCPRPWKEILDDVAKTAVEAAKMANLKMSDFAFVGIGSPGVISVETGTVIAAVNLGFDNVPVSKYLSENTTRFSLSPCLNAPVKIPISSPAISRKRYLSSLYCR